MPRLKASSDVPGALSEREAETLLWGYPLLDGWQKIHEWQAWLHGPQARALWKRYRSRLVNEWLQGLPRLGRAQPRRPLKALLPAAEQVDAVNKQHLLRKRKCPRGLT